MVTFIHVFTTVVLVCSAAIAEMFVINLAESQNKPMVDYLCFLLTGLLAILTYTAINYVWGF